MVFGDIELSVANTIPKDDDIRRPFPVDLPIFDKGFDKGHTKGIQYFLALFLLFDHGEVARGQIVHGRDDASVRAALTTGIVEDIDAYDHKVLERHWTSPEL